MGVGVGRTGITRDPRSGRLRHEPGWDPEPKRGGGGGGGGGAPTNATYVTLTTDATLTQERTLAVGTGLSLTDGGAGGAATIAISDADLIALRDLAATTGMLSRTGAGAFAARTLTAPATGLTITNPTGELGNPTFALANDLAAVEGLSTLGLAVRTAADTWTTREIAVDGILSISHPTGVGGNPTIEFFDTYLYGILPHNQLIGHDATDDHHQYVRYLGRAGGQEVWGGMGSGDDLTLRSTSHATKGYIGLDDTQRWWDSFPTTLAAVTTYRLADFSPSGTIAAATSSSFVGIRMAPTLWQITGAPAATYNGLAFEPTFEHSGDASASLYTFAVFKSGVTSRSTGATATPMLPDTFTDVAVVDHNGTGTCTNGFNWQAISFLSLIRFRSTNGGTMNNVRYDAVMTRPLIDITTAGGAIRFTRRAGLKLTPLDVGTESGVPGDTVATMTMTANGTVTVDDNVGLYVPDQRVSTDIAGSKLVRVTRNAAVWSELAASTSSPGGGTENWFLRSTGAAKSCMVGAVRLGSTAVPSNQLEVAGDAIIQIDGAGAGTIRGSKVASANLNLDANNTATTPGKIVTGSLITSIPGTWVAYDLVPSSTADLANTGSIVGMQVGNGAVITCGADGLAGLQGSLLFNILPTIRSAPVDTTRTTNNYHWLRAAPTFQLDNSTVTTTKTFTVESHRSVHHRPTASRRTNGNAGNMVITEDTAVLSECTLNVGASVTTRRGLWFKNFTGSGTQSAAYGVDIEALTGTTVAGIRNADRTVFTPSTAQTISAVGNTILANATVVMVSNTTGGSITLTSAPTIADGQDGQIIYIVSVGTQNVVVQDQGTLPSSNLRLGAASRTLAPRDNLTLVYSATIGDWIELTFNNVV